MGKVESIKIWPISSNEMLIGLYRDKLPHSRYVKNSRSKSLFKKSVRQKVYENFMQIRNQKNTRKWGEAFKTLKAEVTIYLFSPESCS